MLPRPKRNWPKPKPLTDRNSIWQAQAERRWLAGLLASEKAVTPLLRFLEATEVGAREGAREREAEWERKKRPSRRRSAKKRWELDY